MFYKLGCPGENDANGGHPFSTYAKSLELGSHNQVPLGDPDFT